jgi:hypothetical protein
VTELEAFGAHCREMATAQHRPDCCQCGRSWCCGCIGHPSAKPWGWALDQWEEHAEKCPGNPSAPPCPGCVTALDRAIWQRLADECALWLRQKTTDDTQETLA